MTNYPVGDYLIRIKNAAKAEGREVTTQTSRFIEAIAKKLKEIGILESLEIKEGNIISRLAFHKKAPMLLDLKLVSRPGLRKYLTVEELEGRRRKNASILVLSTPSGVLSSKEALKKKVGGEVIAEIW